MIEEQKRPLNAAREIKNQVESSSVRRRKRGKLVEIDDDSVESCDYSPFENGSIL